MNKRAKILIASISIVFGVIILFNFGKNILMKYIFAHYTTPAVSVSSAIVKSVNLNQHISAVGNFSSINGIDVNSQAAGNVSKIYFQSGQYVLKNSPLIDIDDSIEQATLKFNEADLSLQKTEYQRQEDLFKKNATSKSSVDQAHAKLLEAEANFEKTKAIILQKHIKAAFSGKLGIRQINLGQYIKPGETGIVALQSLDPMYLKFYLPEQVVGQLHENQIINFRVEQNPNLIFKGKITAINSKSDINTHTVEIQATVNNCPTDALNNPEQSNLLQTKKDLKQNKTMVICNHQINKENKIAKFNFLPGMFAEIQIREPRQKNILMVRSTAISYTINGESVFIIEKDPTQEKDKNGQDILVVKRVLVKTGEEQGNYTIIKQGLKAGQKIVASGELKLKDNTRVIINNTIKLKDYKDITILGQ